MEVLQDKKALVTGAGRGIGQAIAVELAKAGADVAISDIKLEALQETAELIRKEGRKVVTLEVDVNNYDSVEKMVQAAAKELGTIDIAVNNAGVLGISKVVDMTPDEWDRVMNVNARGVFFSAKAELAVMLPNKYGRIINTASIAGHSGFPTMSHYSASKFAVVGFTRALAKEIADTGITVNALCPGIVGTGMWRGDNGIAKAWAKEGESEEQSWERQQETLLPQGEAQSTTDMGKLAVYIASAEHLTGQSLIVDGGFLA